MMVWHNSVCPSNLRQLPLQHFYVPDPVKNRRPRLLIAKQHGGSVFKENQGGVLKSFPVIPFAKYASRR
jgi:hypothetical protein